MDFMKHIAILVPRILTLAMTDGVMEVAPAFQPRVTALLIGIELAPCRHGGSDHGADRRLLDVLQHPQHHFAATLDQSQNRWLLLFQSASTPCSLQLPSASLALFFFTASGWP